MAGLNDIIKVTQFFQRLGVPALNVNFYKITSVEEVGDIPMGHIAQAHHELYASEIMPLYLSSTAEFVRTVAENLTEGLEFGEYTNGYGGEITGESLPNWDAADIKQSVGSRLTRSGRKRLPFLSETQSNNAGLTWSAPTIAAVEAWFGEPILLDNPISFDPMCHISPVIVGRTLDVDGHYQIDLAKVQLVTSATVRKVTHQVSRKQG